MSKSNEEIFREAILKHIDFLSDHWVNGDDHPPFSFGGWREEVVNDIVKLHLSTLEAREAEVTQRILESATAKLLKKARITDYADRTEYDEAVDILQGVVKSALTTPSPNQTTKEE